MAMRWVSGVFAACVVVLLGAAPALADIKAFNAAVKAGNYKQAAAEARSVWATWDRQDRDTAVMAREFGFVSYVAGDYAAARDYGLFLKDHGASLPTPDDLLATSAVLLAAADFRLGANTSTRTELFNALKKREAAPGLDLQTALSAEALYMSDWGKGDWNKAWESAKLARTLLERGGSQLAPRALRARSSLVTAGFIKGRQTQDYAEIVDAHDAVIDAIDVATNAADRAELIKLKFHLNAWAYSVQSYFDASQQTGSNIPRQVRDRELKKPATALFPETTPEEIACKMEINTGQVRYPDSQLFQGMVGTVILKLDVDHEGRISKPEVLASVPEAGFADPLMKSIHSASFKRARTAKPGCVMGTRSLVVPVVFRIG